MFESDLLTMINQETVAVVFSLFFRFSVDFDFCITSICVVRTTHYSSYFPLLAVFNSCFVANIFGTFVYFAICLLFINGCWLKHIHTQNAQAYIPFNWMPMIRQHSLLHIDNNGRHIWLCIVSVTVCVCLGDWTSEIGSELRPPSPTKSTNTHMYRLGCTLWIPLLAAGVSLISHFWFRIKFHPCFDACGLGQSRTVRYIYSHEPGTWHRHELHVCQI